MKQVALPDELSSLQRLHKSLDGELRQLSRRRHLTPDEQLRARVIKKEKLHAKDRIRILVNEVRIE